jgi:hypothetical protein
LSDRILIAENRCAALFVSTVSPARSLCAGCRPPPLHGQGPPSIAAPAPSQSVPAKYLEKRLGKNRNEVSAFTLDRISEEMGVAPTFVHYQAENHGYYIDEAA